MLTVRLDPALEQQVNIIANNNGITKSEFIRESIIHYIDIQKNQDAWEIGKNLFGKYSSGKGNLAADRKEILKSKIRAKR